MGEIYAPVCFPELIFKFFQLPYEHTRWEIGGKSGVCPGVLNQS